MVLSMQTLKPPQMLAVVLAAALATLAAVQLLNVYQALCLGIVVAIVAYSFILTLEDKKPPTSKF